MGVIPHDHYEPKAAWEKSLAKRLPIVGLMYDTLMIPTPKNLNWMWIWGIVLTFVLVLQIVTGIVLVMHYTPHVDHAFSSVEHIMRNVNGGHMLRYIHMNGASLFFVAVYAHIFRSMYYGSYKAPREITWIIGMLIYLLMMGTAFMGYVLPWGQMSFWGATVITGLFGAIPFVGEALQTWLLGGPAVDNATLNRFFALHVIALPLVLVFLVIAHIIALHEVGSNNPDGVEIKKNKDANGIPVDGIPFHPYYSVKDIVGVVVFLFFFSVIMFYFPDGGGYMLEHANFIASDPLKTPEHIAPVWYFTPFYAILRAVPDKLGGVIAMGAAIVVLFFLPWIDRSPVKSVRYKGAWYKIMLGLFAVAFIRLGMLGMAEGTPAQTWEMRVWTFIYFAFFVLLFFLSPRGKTRPVPDRVSH